MNISKIGVEDGEIAAISKGMHSYQYCWQLAPVAARMEDPQD